jgi:hypothetical protein
MFHSSSTWERQFDSGGNEEGVDFWECLLPFSPKPSLFLSAFKDFKTRIYTTIIVPVVLCGCETWSLTLREEYRLRALRISGPKRDEVRSGWRKLHNKELHDLYSSPSIVRMIKSRWMRWARHVV